MSTFSESIRRNLYGLTAIALTIALAAPSVLVANVNAEQINSRSIKMSTTQAGASGVDYEVTFTTASAMQSVVIDFCDSVSSPLIGSACTAPTGMVTSGLSAAGWTVSGNNEGNVKLSNASSQAAGVQTITLADVTNPTTVGTFYARITTYGDTTHGGYTGPTEANLGTVVDQGGVALSTTEDIAVSAAVLETLTFCVASTAPTANCADASSNPPSLQLGEGSPKALTTASVSTANAYFQLSTNAAGNSTVRMRNSAASGGLNSGSNVIPPVDSLAGPAAITAGTANFGMRVGTPLAPGTGTVTAASAYGHASNYNMLTDATDSGNGVDSPYGSTIASATGPISNKNVPMTFGATISPTTPAGLYKADLSLIATSSY